MDKARRRGWRSGDPRWWGGALAAVGLLAAAGLSAQGMLQKALFDEVAPHWIYDDWSAAVARAKTSGKPILAVLRCVP